MTSDWMHLSRVQNAAKPWRKSLSEQHTRYLDERQNCCSDVFFIQMSFTFQLETVSTAEPLQSRQGGHVPFPKMVCESEPNVYPSLPCKISSWSVKMSLSPPCDENQRRFEQFCDNRGLHLPVSRPLTDQNLCRPWGAKTPKFCRI